MDRLAWSFVLILAVAGAARGEEPTTAVSLHLPALYGRAFGAQAERWLGWQRLSLAAGLGVRSAAMADYDSLTLGAGVEARRWLGDDPRMRGWYLGLRFDASRTTLDAAGDRRVGTALSLALGASVGYRFLFFDHVELTPAIGLAAVEEIDPSGRMGPATRWTGLVGLTAGWMF